jgi:hypothetical protein
MEYEKGQKQKLDFRFIKLYFLDFDTCMCMTTHEILINDTDVNFGRSNLDVNAKMSNLV